MSQRLFLIITFLYLLSTVSCKKDDEVVADKEFNTLSKFLQDHPDRVLHGWGQSVDRWEFEAIPYFETVGIPTLISAYVSTRELREESGPFDELSIAESFTDKSGVRHDFLIMECLTNEFDITEVLPTLQELGYDLESDDPDLAEKVRTLMEDPMVREQVVEIIGIPDVRIANGEWDNEIIKLAEGIREIDQPVLIRFMQEFIGGQHENDIQGPESFKDAWIHFVELMKEHGATNAEFVWHPNKGTHSTLDEWWPGDEYVDWVAISIFSSSDFDEAKSHSQYALNKGKPFLIAESAPTLNEFADRGTADSGTWHDYFVPYFDLIKEDKNIKAFFYINIDWSNSSTFEWPNSRVQENEFILENYKQELLDPTYMPNDEFWSLFRPQE